MTTAPAEPLLETDHSWAVVDVETSGFQPDTGRVLSVAALVLDPAGRPVQRFSTLVDAGVDPGPVHVHGLTRERLRGHPPSSRSRPSCSGCWTVASWSRTTPRSTTDSSPPRSSEPA